MQLSEGNRCPTFSRKITLVRSFSAFLFAATILLSGCSEEKAKALQLAAQTFQTETDTACSMGADSLKASVAVPPRTRDEISRQLENVHTFNDQTLDTIYSDSEITDAGIKPAIEALHQACQAQIQLAAIYTDLPRGYLLASNDVRRAQKQVVNVTMRFAKLAQIFNSIPTIGKDNLARIKIIEATKTAKAVTDEPQRTALLNAVSEQILENQKKETQNRTQVLMQFAKATSLGEKLSQLSINYDKYTVSDILGALQDFSTLFGQISGNSAGAQNAINQVHQVETRIRNDPLLSPLLDKEFSK